MEERRATAIIATRDLLTLRHVSSVHRWQRLAEDRHITRQKQQLLLQHRSRATVNLLHPQVFLNIFFG